MPAREVITEVTPENFEAAVAERERMRRVLDNYDSDQRERTLLPPDAHEYYGRLQKLERQIERVHREMQWAQEYDRQMAEVKQRGVAETVANLGQQSAPATLEHAQQEARLYRRLVGEESERTFDEREPLTSLLSADDYAHAYKLGGNKAVQEWYFEQKRELQLGRKYMPEQSQEGAAENAVTTKDVERAMRERQL